MKLRDLRVPLEKYFWIIHTLMFLGLYAPVLSRSAGRLYWGDAGSKTVKVMDVDGGNMATLLTTTHHLSAITVFQDYLFYSAIKPNSRYRVSSHVSRLPYWYMFTLWYVLYNRQALIGCPSRCLCREEGCRLYLNQHYHLSLEWKDSFSFYIQKNILEMKRFSVIHFFFLVVLWKSSWQSLVNDFLEYKKFQIRQRVLIQQYPVLQYFDLKRRVVDLTGWCIKQGPICTMLGVAG